jgi:CheY-like chemotaxis protein
VVVVDDDTRAMTFVRDLFESAGFEDVIGYDDPIYAFREMVRRTCPDLIVTEFRMTRITGTDLLNQLSLLYGNVKAILTTCDSADARKCATGYPVIDKGGIGFRTDLLALTESALGTGIASSDGLLRQACSNADREQDTGTIEALARESLREACAACAVSRLRIHGPEPPEAERSSHIAGRNIQARNVVVVDRDSSQKGSI